MTITLLWWVLPLSASILAVVWALWPRDSSGGGYGPDFGGFFRAVAAVLICLAVWLAAVLGDRVNLADQIDREKASCTTRVHP